jgi:hypothetical protein
MSNEFYLFRSAIDAKYTSYILNETYVYAETHIGIVFVRTPATRLAILDYIEPYSHYDNRTEFD